MLTTDNTAPVSDLKTGAFTLRNVLFARQGVTVAGLPSHAYVTDIRQGGFSIMNDGIISADSEEPLEIRVSSDGGIVYGMVRDVAGNSVTGGYVTLVPAIPRQGNSQLYKRSGIGADGQFEVGGVAPGEYRLYAWTRAFAGDVEEDPSFMRKYEGFGSAVAAKAGLRTNVDVRIIAVAP